jgi:hypothetical protein
MFFDDGLDLATAESLGRVRHSSFLACKGRYKLCKVRRVRIRVQIQSERYWIRALGGISGMEFAMKRNSMSSWRRNLHVRQVYNLEGAELRRILGLIGSFDGGGVIKGTPVRNLPTRSRW